MDLPSVTSWPEPRAWTGSHEPRGGVAGAAGGLLGVVGGDAWQPRGPVGTFGAGSAVTAALVDLGHSYVAHRGQTVPVEVAGSHDGVPGTAWLLPVALARPDVAGFVGDTVVLATAAGISRAALPACVAYVGLAACLFAGWPVDVAVETTTGELSFVDAGRPRFSGDAAFDGLLAGVWALRRPAGVAEVVSLLSNCTTPAVCAAAAGLVGLRDGVESVPRRWHRLRPAVGCLALAPALVRLRHYGEQRHTQLTDRARAQPG